MFAVLDTGAADSDYDRNKRTSWQMDENPAMTSINDDGGHALPYGRRGKTGQIV